MEKVDVIYHCIHKRFTDRVSRVNGKILARKEAEYIIANLYHIPKNLRSVVLKEMELLNLIRLNGKSEIRVLEPTTDLENTSAMFRKVGLF